MAGATAIRIYRSPVKPSKPKPLDLAAPDTTAAKEPKSKTYDSYVLSYYSGGKRIRTRFNEPQQARDKADAIKTSLLNEDSTALQLTGEDALIYARAKMLTSHLGLPTARDSVVAVVWCSRQPAGHEGRLHSGVRAPGTSTPSAHAPVRRTPDAPPDDGPATPSGSSRATEGPSSVS